MQQLGFTSILQMITELFIIIFVWYLLQEVNWDKLLREPRSMRARMLVIILAIGAAHVLTQFIFAYMGMAGNLKYLAG
jgi:uncharacterized integral membrane protein (TIGR02327 family)